ncbi:MAG TPA: class I SAM-dependent methyltransferase [Rhodothermales bacterium]|nr:class I SAM-dependent methyltransferase [Rhodothermales bacterium]
MAGTSTLFATAKNPKIYSYEYFEQLHEVEERHWWSKGVRDIAGAMIARHFRARTALDVLDAGCGTGISLSWLEQFSTPKPVTGIDISEHALGFCRARGHAQVSTGSVMELPYDDEAFDLVVCNDVIQHLPDDVKALREFYRVLRPGGAVSLRTNCKIGIDTEKGAERDDYRMYTPAELKEKVEAAGLEMVQISYVNMLMSLTTLAKRYLRERKQGAYGDRGLPIRLLPPHLAWLNGLLRGIMRVEARYLSRASRTLPFGSAIIFLAQKPI